MRCDYYVFITEGRRRRIGLQKVPLLHELTDLISLRTPQAFGRKPNALPLSYRGTNSHWDALGCI